MLATSVIFGSVPTWILVVTTAVLAWRLTTSGGAGAMEVLAQSNKVLEKALDDQKQEVIVLREKTGSEIRDLRIENGELRGRTDVALALNPIIEWTHHHEAAAQQVMDWTQLHERRAQERHDAMLGVLSLIADRLGPDPNGHSAAA